MGDIDITDCYSITNCTDSANQTLIDNITNARADEQGKFNVLNGVDTGGSAELDGFITDINKLTQDRMDLYDILINPDIKSSLDLLASIDPLSSSYRDSSTTSWSDYDTAASGSTGSSSSGNVDNRTADEKLNDSKRIAIDAYYSKNFDSQRILFKSLFIYLAIILILLYLPRWFPMLPQTPFSVAIAIIIIFAGFSTVRKIYDMNKRRVNNFDELDWWWSPKLLFKNGLPEGTTDENGGTTLKDLYRRDCKGANGCDDGTKYDSTTGKCKVEGFQNAFPIKSCGRRKPVYNQAELYYQKVSK